MLIPSIANPWVIAAVTAGLIGAYAAGRIDGNKITEGAAAREERIAMLTREETQRTTAKAIAGIEVRNVTTRQVLQKEIVREPVYVDCKHSAVGMRAVNSALSNGTYSPGDSKLSGANPAQR